MFAGASLDENSGAFCELKANFFRLILTKAELLALTYDDINLEEKTISITKSYQRLKGKDVITQPKTPKSIRIITMSDFLADEFREYCSHLYGIMKNERLFHFTKSHMEHGGVLPWAAMPLTAGNDRKKAAALISQNRHQ